MNRDHSDVRTTAELVHDEPAHPQWIDRLVELQVLADNGDSAAAAAAASWIAEDPEARRVWEVVEQTCDLIRNGSDRGE
jgi:hypothetical protein